MFSSFSILGRILLSIFLVVDVFCVRKIILFELKAIFITDLKNIVEITNFLLLTKEVNGTATTLHY